LQFWDVIGGDINAIKSKDLWNFFARHVCFQCKRRVSCVYLRFGGCGGCLDTSTGMYHAVQDSVWSTDWLEKNERCLDNMKPGISKMPQAGHGEFATRAIQKGGIIATASLVQLNSNTSGRLTRICIIQQYTRFFARFSRGVGGM
jgi:hypothetical protein